MMRFGIPYFMYAWWLFSVFRYWWWLVRWFIITCVFLWILTPYCMCMVCVVVFFMYGVSDVVKEGSRSHLLVGFYTMHHFLPLPIYLRILCLYMRGFYAGCRYRVSTSLNCQDERTLSHYLNGKRGEINS